MFSTRTAWDLRPNRFAEVLAGKRLSGERVIDLTNANPTACGFRHPGPRALAALADARGAAYAPTPFGLDDARAAVSRYQGERGEPFPAGRIVLSASTSEAYAWLFKLLADPGDEVLVPRPSYPLFDFLARLEGVELRPYRLEHRDGRWRLDLGSVAGAMGPRTRAVLAVSPNNPTGSVLDPGERAALDGLAAERGAAIIVDQVFADFPLAATPAAPPSATVSPPRALTFTLSGLSKVCGLPQVKLAWIGCGGPDAPVADALARLEVVADTYLSVGTPVQVAAPTLLAARHAFQDECRARIRANLAALGARAARALRVRLLEAQAGWYACLRVEDVADEEDLVLTLIAEYGVVVHPGYFFDFDDDGAAYLVLSLIVPEDDFAEGVGRVLRELGSG